MHEGTATAAPRPPAAAGRPAFDVTDDGDPGRPESCARTFRAPLELRPLDPVRRRGADLVLRWKFENFLEFCPLTDADVIAAGTTTVPMSALLNRTHVTRPLSARGTKRMSRTYREDYAVQGELDLVRVNRCAPGAPPLACIVR